MSRGAKRGLCPVRTYVGSSRTHLPVKYMFDCLCFSISQLSLDRLLPVSRGTVAIIDEPAQVCPHGPRHGSGLDRGAERICVCTATILLLFPFLRAEVTLRRSHLRKAVEQPCGREHGWQTLVRVSSSRDCRRVDQ